jgi:hypothetical protein
MLSLRPASMKLPVSATIRKVRASAMSMRESHCVRHPYLSIEIIDRRQRKIAFGILLKNFQIDRARTRFERLGHRWKDTAMKAKKAKKSAKKKTAKKKKK